MDNKINKFLDELQTYNWKRLDKFEDMFEQFDEYNKILKEFENLIYTESQTEEFSFKNIYELLKSFRYRIEDIIYFGILKSKVNTILLPNQLNAIVKKIEFENYKKSINSNQCECNTRFKFNIEPKVEFLKKLGCNFDGYYDTYIYKCQICEFDWMITVDDINGTGVYTIWDKTMYPINKKNCS